MTFRAISMGFRLGIPASLLAAVMTAMMSGCTPHQPQVVVPVKQRDPSYVLSVVIDASGSFDTQLETKAWPYLQKVIQGFFRDRAGEDDLFILGQISAVPVAPIFEGSPKTFARLYGNPTAFKNLIASKTNPNGSRVYDSIADVAHYAGRYVNDHNQSFLCVLTDGDDNFPDQQKSEERLVSSLAPFVRPNTAVGIYWVDLNQMTRMEQLLKRGGVKNFVVRSAIEADPQLPVWSEP